MKTSHRSVLTAAVAFICVAPFITRAPAEDFEAGMHWRGWVDMGGTFGASANMKEFFGPTTGKFTLSPGVQFDMGFGYRITPWLQVGPELGMIYNTVDEFGGCSYRDTSLFQMPILANVTLEYPYWGRFVPFAGAGVGGVVSYITFGENWDWEPDGSGCNFVFGCQAFAGFRFHFSNSWSMGVIYRFMVTDQQTWDVEWWNGGHFDVGIDTLKMHSVCLTMTGTF